jgi:hypothetical protein
MGAVDEALAETPPAHSPYLLTSLDMRLGAPSHDQGLGLKCLVLAALLYLDLVSEHSVAGAPPVTVFCRTGRDLADALADKTCNIAILTQNIVVNSWDFDGIRQPVIRDRNFTISGGWMLLDLNYTKAKVCPGAR